MIFTRRYSRLSSLSRLHARDVGPGKVEGDNDKGRDSETSGAKPADPILAAQWYRKLAHHAGATVQIWPEHVFELPRCRVEPFIRAIQKMFAEFLPLRANFVWLLLGKDEQLHGH